MAVIKLMLAWSQLLPADNSVLIFMVLFCSITRGILVLLAFYFGINKTGAGFS